MDGVSLSLAGKVALITGGSRGIGAETVRLFCRAGARVVFNYRSAAGAAQSLVDQCGGPGTCVAIQQELSTAAEGRALVAQACAIFGWLDCLVVNHGVWPSHEAPIESMAEAQWSSTVGINLDSVFGLVQGAVSQMKLQATGNQATGNQATGNQATGNQATGNQATGNQATGNQAIGGGTTGHIVLVSSTAAQRGEAFHADYAATKGALISLTKSLSSELAGQGIYVNCVAPGWVATDMSASTLADPAARQKIFSTIPLGRVGTTSEIAGPILFLCTPFAGFMSGEIVNVNGGAVLVG